MIRRFLIRMFVRNLAGFGRLSRDPIGGRRNAAVFATGLWLSLVVLTALTLLLVVLRNSVAPQLNPLVKRDWLCFMMWVPVLIACDQYVEALVRQLESGRIAEDIARPSGSRQMLYWLLQWASIPVMLVVMAEARSVVP
jgi:hypothetical protein